VAQRERDIALVSDEESASGERRVRREGAPAATTPNREELLKQFDKNGDGELDEEERAAMRERFGQRRRGTNAPPEAVQQ
jgi:hypothetical protein